MRVLSVLESTRHFGRGERRNPHPSLLPFDKGRRDYEVGSANMERIERQLVLLYPLFPYWERPTAKS